MIFDWYFMCLLVSSGLVLLVVFSVSLVMVVLLIIGYCITWFLFLVFGGNMFIMGSLVTLLYLGGMMVLFTYSIMLSGAVGGDFEILPSGYFLRGVVMLLLVGGMGFGYFSYVSEDDTIYHFHNSGYLILVSAVVLLVVLFFCIVELVDDYKGS